jgi:hypothetical protein
MTTILPRILPTQFTMISKKKGQYHLLQQGKKQQNAEKLAVADSEQIAGCLSYDSCGDG